MKKLEQANSHSPHLGQLAEGRTKRTSKHGANNGAYSKADPATISANCRAGHCGNCYSLRCGHDCHTQVTPHLGRKVTP